MTPDEHLQMLRENGSKPVRITRKGTVFIGDDEFPYPIITGGIKVQRSGPEHHGFNILTVSIIVGEVTMESRPPAGVLIEPSSGLQPGWLDKGES